MGGKHRTIIPLVFLARLDFEVLLLLELADRDVELRVVGVLPDEDGARGLEDVVPGVEEADLAGVGEDADGALGAEFEGEVFETLEGEGG